MKILCVKTILLVAFIVAASHAGFAQPGEKIPSAIKGKVTDQEYRKGLPFVHIWNESLRIPAIADTTGFFTLYAKEGDTLAFSAIGYYSKMVIVDKRKPFLDIELAPRTYDIAEARILAFRSYADFKQQFLDLKLPETETDRLRNMLTQQSKAVAREAYDKAEAERAAEGAVLAAVPILTPEEKQRIKLKEILKEDQIQKVIDKKYNREIVAELTGLEDKDLDDFILFCKFDKKYLYETNQYDILVKVLQKFEEFKRTKKSGMVIENNVDYA